MLVLGLSGGLDPSYPALDRNLEPRYGESAGNWGHDAAAVLLSDGEVLCAVEEERLSRVKHTAAFPGLAVEACLTSTGLRLADVDRIAYFGKESSNDVVVVAHSLANPRLPPVWKARQLLAERLRDFGPGPKDPEIHFVDHHLAHALSAIEFSGMSSGLVLTLDAQGDELSGAVWRRSANRPIRRLRALPAFNSLGAFYLRFIGLLGYRLFDEYKVMGLAPYGNAESVRHLFASTYSLGPDGTYSLRLELPQFGELFMPRRANEPIRQVHKDFAAGLQETLERIVLHVLEHFSTSTGERNLCLAGGVALNCTLTGKILRSGWFDDVFVQPASHDAGCALGAALAMEYADPASAEDTSQGNGASATVVPRGRPRMTHVYWGRDVGTPAAVQRQVAEWSEFVDVRVLEDVFAETASLIASGSTCGWVQGRSEFGPRSLGNRSILADPRQAANRDYVNAIVKKRDEYRPFAPSVPEEEVHKYFGVEPGAQFPFMVFCCEVRESARQLLPAVTHVDGSARIHTVSKAVNERYWRLLVEFGKITGVPVLLNTSFNNFAEPIVDSVADAITCYLTTGLDVLVIGDLLLRRKMPVMDAVSRLSVQLPRQLRLTSADQYAPGRGRAKRYACSQFSAGSKHEQELSKPLFELLSSGSKANVASALAALEPDAAQLAVQELVALWEKRMVILRP